ncbi:hypothetical protein [Bacteroides congonensis]|uniref:hypothetical protein n=1 Tax=Bacteroides congonensis TaxID=1871006 RepID=UPI003A8A8CAB
MSEWISIKEAAKRHNLDEEYIQLWADMKVITAYLKEYNTVVVNDECLRAFLKVKEQGKVLAYVGMLERFGISKSEACVTYAYLLSARDKEIEMYREAKTQRDAFRRMWLEQNDQMRDLAVELALEQTCCYKCWLKKLCMTIRKITARSCVGMRFPVRLRRNNKKSER